MNYPSELWSLSNKDQLSRSKLISFWLSCPDDQLEFLWNSPFGSATIELVRQLDANTIFSSDEVALRNKIGEFFNTNGLSHQLACKLMIANFLLSPPGLLTINNINSYFPTWLCTAYNTIYQFPATPARQESNSSGNEVIQVPPNDQISTPSLPDFGPFPATLAELASNRLHLNRILGLSNLYYIDPEDSEITNELVEVRNSFANLILVSNTDELQRYWPTEVGERYWALVRSGIQKESLNSVDEAIKANSVKVLSPADGGGFSAPNSINAFLVSMMYFLPGTMQVANPESNIPSWLIKPYQEIFAHADLRS